MKYSHIAAVVAMLAAPAAQSQQPQKAPDETQQLADALHKLQQKMQREAQAEARRPSREMMEWLGDKEHENADADRGKTIESTGCDVVDDASKLKASEWERQGDGSYLVRIGGMWWPIDQAVVFQQRYNPTGSAIIWYAFDDGGWMHVCGFAPGPQA